MDYNEYTKSFKKKGNESLKTNKCTLILGIILVLLWMIIVMYIVPQTSKEDIHSHEKAFNTFIQSNEPINKIIIPDSPLKIKISRGQTNTINKFINKKYINKNSIIRDATNSNDPRNIQISDDETSHSSTKDSNIISTKNINKNDDVIMEKELETFINDVQYRSICPKKFPNKALGLNDLPKVCSNLKKFKIQGYCNAKNCSKCVPPNSESMPWANDDVKPWLNAFENTKEKRRNELQSMLKDVDINAGPIMIMAVNHGYSYLYLNWFCSVKYNGLLTDDLISRTIVITTDIDTQKTVNDTGFTGYYPTWLGTKNLKRITKNAAQSFALGGHRFIVALQIAMVNDLIHLGYDVLIQDTDIIWKDNPIKYLYLNKYNYIDIQMSVDGRMDQRGPGNSGFFIVRSNCKTKIFMDTMISLIGLVIVGRSDQILWNTLIDERLFRMINFETLNHDVFLNGNRASKQKYIEKIDFDKMITFHASWTTDIFDKIERFYNIDSWYFTDNKCNDYFDINKLPDLKNRKSHIRNKTQEQELRLKKLGFVRDTS